MTGLISTQTPILYSFRRCPYAMRARMALVASRQPCLLREVVLREKPAQMVSASPKATVPVLVLPDGAVIDQSLDIMLWALAKNDPENWLDHRQISLDLVAENDGPFKHSLDRYKYATRYDGENPMVHRQLGEAFLQKLDNLLSENTYLSGPGLSLADIAIFPFIRQFANTDRQWFDHLNLPALQGWLTGHLASDRFKKVMKKYRQWKTGDENHRFVV